MSKNNKKNCDHCNHCQHHAHSRSSTPDTGSEIVYINGKRLPIQQSEPDFDVKLPNGYELVSKDSSSMSIRNSDGTIIEIPLSSFGIGTQEFKVIHGATGGQSSSMSNGFQIQSGSRTFILNPTVVRREIQIQRKKVFIPGQKDFLTDFLNN